MKTIISMQGSQCKMQIDTGIQTYSPDKNRYWSDKVRKPRAAKHLLFLLIYDTLFTPSKY